MSIDPNSFNEIIAIINNSNIKHVSFDFWDTLYTSNTLFKETRNKFLVQLSQKNSSEIQEIITHLSISHNLSFKSNIKCMNANELNICLLKQIGIKKDFNSIINNLYEIFISMPPLLSNNVLELLEYLFRNKITLSILSNTAYIPGFEIRKVLEKDQIVQYFSFCIFSDEIRYGKPSEIVFNRMFQEIKKIHQSIPLNQIIHIGDNHDNDIKPANDFGILSLIV